MKALVLYGPRDLRLEEVDIPRAPNNWCLVETKAVGICGTDKAFYIGTYPLFKKPLIPGHEVVGEVVEGPEDLVGRRLYLKLTFLVVDVIIVGLDFILIVRIRRLLG